MVHANSRFNRLSGKLPKGGNHGKENESGMAVFSDGGSYRCGDGCLDLHGYVCQ